MFVSIMDILTFSIPAITPVLDSPLAERHVISEEFSVSFKLVNTSTLGIGMIVLYSPHPSGPAAPLPKAKKEGRPVTSSAPAQEKENKLELPHSRRPRTK